MCESLRCAVIIAPVQSERYLRPVHVSVYGPNVLVAAKNRSGIVLPSKPVFPNVILYETRV